MTLCHECSQGISDDEARITVPNDFGPAKEFHREQCFDAALARVVPWEPRLRDADHASAFVAARQQAELMLPREVVLP